MSKGKFRYLRTSFWDDDKILETLTPEQRYFYIFLMTNPDTTQLGIYKLSRHYTLIRLGWSPTVKIEDHIRALQEKGFVVYDESTKEIGLLNWAKYNYTKSIKVIQCIAKELEDVKSYEVLKAMQEVCKITDIKKILTDKQRSLKKGGENWETKVRQEQDDDKTNIRQAQDDDKTIDRQPPEPIDNQPVLIGYGEKEKRNKEKRKKEEESSSESSFFSNQNANKEEVRKFLLKKYGRKKIVEMSNGAKFSVDEILDKFIHYWFDEQLRDWESEARTGRGIKTSFEAFVSIEHSIEEKPAFCFEDYLDVYKKIAKSGMSNEEEKETKRFLNKYKIEVKDFKEYLFYWKNINRAILSNVFAITKEKNYNGYVKGLSN